MGGFHTALYPERWKPLEKDGGIVQGEQLENYPCTVSSWVGAPFMAALLSQIHSYGEVLPFGTPSLRGNWVKMDNLRYTLIECVCWPYKKRQRHSQRARGICYLWTDSFRRRQFCHSLTLDFLDLSIETHSALHVEASWFTVFWSNNNRNLMQHCKRQRKKRPLENRFYTQNESKNSMLWRHECMFKQVDLGGI